jgi:DNA-binding transcriptional LysR family regulator
MDRLTSLTVFVRVVEGGGFSAAARRLNMSVTAASKHVQTLEDRLGARLLNRTTRKVSLTEIGREYYERANQVLTELDEADRIAGSLQATPRGVIKLHCHTYIIRFLGSVLAEYQTLYPAVALDVTTGERMIDLVEEGFDLAIRAAPPPDSGLIVRRLTPWRFIVCCAPSYLDSHPAPERPEDLVHHNCLRYAFSPFGDNWPFEGPDGKVESVKVTGDLVTNSGELLRRFALAGRGIFMAPSFVVGEDVVTSALVRLLPAYRPEAFAIHAIYPHRRHLSAKVRSLIDLLAARLAEHRQWVEPDGQ